MLYARRTRRPRVCLQSCTADTAVTANSRVCRARVLTYGVSLAAGRDHDAWPVGFPITQRPRVSTFGTVSVYSFPFTILLLLSSMRNIYDSPKRLARDACFIYFFLHPAIERAAPLHRHPRRFKSSQRGRLDRVFYENASGITRHPRSAEAAYKVGGHVSAFRSAYT